MLLPKTDDGEGRRNDKVQELRVLNWTEDSQTQVLNGYLSLIYHGFLMHAACKIQTR